LAPIRLAKELGLDVASLELLHIDAKLIEPGRNAIAAMQKSLGFLSISEF
jgi:hypothetical protein